MSDKWMNIGHEDDALKPYIQPSPDFTDEKRLGKKKTNKQAFIFKTFCELLKPHKICAGSRFEAICTEGLNVIEQKGLPLTFTSAQGGKPFSCSRIRTLNRRYLEILIS